MFVNCYGIVPSFYSFLACVPLLTGGMPIAAFADTEPVYINEFMAKNESTLADGNGVYSDWIELYNSSDTPVSLTGWYLTDSSDTLTKWVFPEK